MSSYTYKVIDSNQNILGTFNDIQSATIFVKAYFNEYYKESFCLKIEQFVE